MALEAASGFAVHVPAIYEFLESQSPFSVALPQGWQGLLKVVLVQEQAFTRSQTFIRVPPLASTRSKPEGQTSGQHLFLFFP